MYDHAVCGCQRVKMIMTLKGTYLGDLFWFSLGTGCAGKENLHSEAQNERMIF